MAAKCRDLSIMWATFTLFTSGASKENGVKLAKIKENRVDVGNTVVERFTRYGLIEQMDEYIEKSKTTSVAAKPEPGDEKKPGNGKRTSSSSKAPPNTKKNGRKSS